MNIKTLLTALLFGSMTTSLSAQQTLTLGGYDDDAINTTSNQKKQNAYDGDINNCPISFAYFNSGAQLIYDKEDLLQMAGGTISSISLSFANDDFWTDVNFDTEYTGNIKLYIQEEDANSFPVEDGKKKFFVFDESNPVADVEYTIAAADGHEIVIDFDTPYTYTGKNLVITISNTSDDLITTGNSGTGIPMSFIYRNDVSSNKALTLGSDDTTFEDYVTGHNYKTDYNVKNVTTPAIRFSFTRSLADAPATASVTVGEAGYTTFIAPIDIDFSQNADVTAYIVTDATEDIILEKVEAAPTGTPLVIKASAGTYTLSKAASQAASLDNNLLLASYGVDVNPGSKFYVLSQVDGVVGFNKLRDRTSGSYANGTYKSLITIPAGKAYLDLTNSANAPEFIAFDANETTGISQLNATAAENTAVFNLAGQLVNNTYKGVVVKNGKKLIQK